MQSLHILLPINGYHLAYLVLVSSLSHGHRYNRVESALVKYAIALIVAATMAVAAGTTAARAQSSRNGTPGPDLSAHKAVLQQYCVGCHNSRNPLPANDPVNLETTSLDNLLTQAATWERVLRKLNVRAMPPQGMPRPEQASIDAFVSDLESSLDRSALAWAAARGRDS